MRPSAHQRYPVPVNLPGPPCAFTPTLPCLSQSPLGFSPSSHKTCSRRSLLLGLLSQQNMQCSPASTPIREVCYCKRTRQADNSAASGTEHAVSREHRPSWVRNVQNSPYHCSLLHTAIASNSADFQLPPSSLILVFESMHLLCTLPSTP